MQEKEEDATYVIARNLDEVHMACAAKWAASTPIFRKPKLQVIRHDVGGVILGGWKGYYYSRIVSEAFTCSTNAALEDIKKK